MTTPLWEPGHLYQPGALVRPRSSGMVTAQSPDNASFEVGTFTDWTPDNALGTGDWTASNTAFAGTKSAQFTANHDGTGPLNGVYGIMKNDFLAPVRPGQVISASCRIYRIASGGTFIRGGCYIYWLNASEEEISVSMGVATTHPEYNDGLVGGTSAGGWTLATVTGTAPAGAAFARMAVVLTGNGTGGTALVDDAQWNYTFQGYPDGLLFRATQTLAGTSGTSEPVWPIVSGDFVIDNDITWTAVYASRVIWEASSILESGSMEPTWPTEQDVTVLDNRVAWKAMSRRVLDEKCPNSKIVAIAAKKIFAADDDIMAFSATVNPLDWTTPNDAGYIPFGLNTYGGTDIAAAGLYRSNLVIFNAQGYQMWQVDPDPANIAILDSQPVGCPPDFEKSVQPNGDDLLFCASQGIRTIGIAGASTNLNAQDFGKQIDPLVKAKIKAGERPRGLYFPGSGQSWTIFGAEAFVLTSNGKTKDWSRYVFPSDIEGFAILNEKLYLRTGDTIWEFSEDASQDGITCVAPKSRITASFIADTDFIGTQLGGLFLIETDSVGSLISATYSVPDLVQCSSTSASPDGDLVLALYDPDETLVIDSFSTVTIYESDQTTVRATFNTADAEFMTGEEYYGAGLNPTFAGQIFVWRWFTETGDPVFQGGDVDDTFYVAYTRGDAELWGCSNGTDFEGFLEWPYLDCGPPGVDKTMEGFDLAVDGTVSVSFGYNQKTPSLATTGYEVEGDTVAGTLIPMPIRAPTFQMRLTFSAAQVWEWQATNLYFNI